MTPIHPLFQFLHHIFSPQFLQQSNGGVAKPFQPGVGNAVAHGVPQQQGGGLGLAASPQSRPVPLIGYDNADAAFTNSGAQALQQQQNLPYMIQDPSLQGGGQLTNALYAPAGQINPTEDYGIGGTDMQQQPWQRPVQYPQNNRLQSILQVYKHLK
jgi:hypothetical protein